VAERVHGRSGEWIVGRHGAIGVQAQDLPGERLEPLGELGDAGVADAEVELAVRSELQSAAIMHLGRGQAIEQDNLVGGDAVAKREASDAVDASTTPDVRGVAHV
jgi:hypothetical protein